VIVLLAPLGTENGKVVLTTEISAEPNVRRMPVTVKSELLAVSVSVVSFSVDGRRLPKKMYEGVTVSEAIARAGGA
jgi:hypothetical protein